MIKNYTFTYNVFQAQACFKVNTKTFTDEHAKATLQFFLWDYDKEANPIDEVMKKYAMKAIEVSAFNDYNTLGVINEFKNIEGFCKLDGESGITLTHITNFKFDEDDLDMIVATD